MLARAVMHTARYHIVLALRRDLRKFAFNYSALQCTVQRALKVVTTCEEC